jgi:hypothetical protein
MNAPVTFQPGTAGMMPRRILRFPPRGPFAVRVSQVDGAWLVVCRSHGWLFGSRRDALIEAAKIAAGFAVAVEVVKAITRENSQSFPP